MPLGMPVEFIFSLYWRASSDYVEIYRLLSNFAVLLRDIEDLLEKKSTTLQELLKDVRKLKLNSADFSLYDASGRVDFNLYDTEDWPFVWEWLYEDLNRLMHYTANELRKALFTAIYSLIEPAIDTRIQFIKERDNLQLSLNDIKGQGLKRDKAYLVTIAGINLPDLEWSKVTDLNKLRNCVVHGQSDLSYCKYQAHLRNYISRQDYLSLDAHDRIVFHKGFCESALSTVRDFFIGLDQQSVGDQDFPC